MKGVEEIVMLPKIVLKTVTADTEINNIMCREGNHSMFLSLSLPLPISLPSPLS